MKKTMIVLTLVVSSPALTEERIPTAWECRGDLTCLEKAKEDLVELRKRLEASRNKPSDEAWSTVHEAERALGLPESEEPRKVDRSLPQGGTEIYREIFGK